MIQINKRIVFSFVLFFGGVTGAYILLDHKSIEQYVFLGLVILSISMAILVAFSDRIKEFNLKEMKLVLYKMKKTKNEIQESEKKIQEVAGILADLIYYHENSMITFPTSEKEKEWLTLKLKTIESLSRSRLESPFRRYSQSMSTIDPNDPNVEDHRKLIIEDLTKDLQADISCMKQTCKE